MQTYGRSTLEIAEDNLLELVSPVFNISRGDAQRLCIHRRELGSDFRKAGQVLLDAWEGTREQIESVNKLLLAKRLCILKNCN
ncbi:hypothetical protein K8B83_14880 [Shewanella inventionis]|jgi:hypothetical protein|uniref:hypothetical protein n=1 Tax=Shewanella inventionis TaxID=1738770 RepID=UPI001CBD53FF|nr:hypothetical protein [Shewanella inventionis]UAL42159.1 hypothetical protein K8B83_14880 [Shewanella inventionis]